MEQTTPSAEILEQIPYPAFLVKDGTVVSVNTSAAQRCIQVDTAVSSLICVGAEEYHGFTSGGLSIALSIENVQCPATVTAVDDCHLFVLDSDYDTPELQAFALAAQNLREPLSSVMASTQQLMINDCMQDEKTKAQISSIRQGLHQLLRMVGNMSDSGRLTKASAYTMEYRDAVWVFDEVLQKAASLIRRSGRKLEYSVPKISVSTAIDAELLERAILNLISNALKYSPQGSSICASLTHSKNKLIFTVENAVQAENSTARTNLFSRYLREPGLSMAGSGLGLGLSIVRKVAMMHGGTVLAEFPADDRMRTTLTVSTKPTERNLLRSPVLLPVDYTGGHDHAVVELSDVLPSHLFDGNL